MQTVCLSVRRWIMMTTVLRAYCGAFSPHHRLVFGSDKDKFPELETNYPTDISDWRKIEGGKHACLGKRVQGASSTVHQDRGISRDDHFAAPAVIVTYGHSSLTIPQHYAIFSKSLDHHGHGHER